MRRDMHLLNDRVAQLENSHQNINWREANNNVRV